MFDWLSDPNAWLSLATLVILEIILGIDNIIFLSLVVAKLPIHQQTFARRLGLTAAMLMRVLLLSSLAWIAHLAHPLFYVYTNHITLQPPEPSTSSLWFLAVSSRDLVLFFGGLFLIWKGVIEIRDMFRKTKAHTISSGNMTLFKAITQIMLLDIVFSLDSVITAIGLSDHLFIMVAAVIIAVLLMMIAAKPIGDFVETYPTVKMLALVFLILVGLVLIIDGVHYEVPKGYIYFALFFSVAVETLNLLKHRCGSP